MIRRHFDTLKAEETICNWGGVIINFLDADDADEELNGGIFDTASYGKCIQNLHIVIMYIP